MASFALAAAVCAAPFNIQGTNYYDSVPTEIVSVTFQQSDGGVTTNNYYGFVRLVVDGTGLSFGSSLNDAFYVYTDGAGAPVAPANNASYYQLGIDTSTLVGSFGNPTPANRAARNYIYYDVSANNEVSPVYVPAYNANHSYEFIIDVESLVSWGGSPSQIHFGVIDGQFGDNQGSYRISVTQLTPAAVPEPGTFGLAAAGIAIAVLRLRRRG
jgi:hypothetical protein